MIKNDFKTKESMTIPVRNSLRQRYSLDEKDFNPDGQHRIPGIREARHFSDLRNKIHRDDDGFIFAQAGDIYALSVINTVYRIVYAYYRDNIDVDCFKQSRQSLESYLTPEKTMEIFTGYFNEFPLIGNKSPFDHLKEQTENEDNRDRLTKELISLFLFNINPALNPYRDLLTDKELSRTSRYDQGIAILDNFFNSMPPLGREKLPLINFLRKPIDEHPHDLKGQLQYMVDNWADILGDFLLVLLGSLDVISEERKFGFLGPGDPQGIDFSFFDDTAHYSADSEWMPNVVLLAKSTLVWLDQLSKEYKREIVRLDQVPDSELDKLAGRGFNSLWLIGVWGRSNASRNIKRICGNPEAEASAYSLYHYEIADEIGGWSALESLRKRCAERGIRLASDMVPNHSGIDSDWIRHYPDRFLSLPYNPYPQYTYNGVDLCGDDRVGVFLEDHYYDKTDCAVVFKRVDYHTGDTRYIYHGNDGTAMPWNDTAQINFLNPEAREAVIQQILHVAKNFPIIRFDAAMTLAKKHIQRLWFPPPGQGGDIPSRSEHGLSPADFEKAIPEEFWREVVQRVAREVPDTLLLAEAFWMMEGFFVRNLGMHRVYNSAFMNMLKMEKNQEYRDMIKTTLEYDPQILQRFVNFMNNPDEDTAVAQFGKGDKYFGVCTMMATMPGLPMFGHGQIEGFTEKYGMEYRRAYYNETPDNDLINRHAREIFPLLKKRHLYSHVHCFRLYDFWTVDHSVNENVFVYSNCYGDERSLVAFNNAYEQTSGWIKQSVPFRIDQDTESSRLESQDIIKSMGFCGKPDHFVIFRENRTNLWYIRRSSDILNHGMYFQLSGYETQTFMEIREVSDVSGAYAKLHNQLDGGGIDDIYKAYREILLRPFYEILEELLTASVIKKLETLEEPLKATEAKKLIPKKLLAEIIGKINKTAKSEAELTETHYKQFAGEMAKMSAASLWIGKRKKPLGEEESLLNAITAKAYNLLWLLLPFFRLFLSVYGKERTSEWLLADWTAKTFFPELPPEPVVTLLSFLEQHALVLEGKESGDPATLFLTLFRSEAFRREMGTNLFDNILWFGGENMNALLGKIEAATLCRLFLTETPSKAPKQIEIFMKPLLSALKKSDYQVARYLEYLKTLDEKPTAVKAKK